MEKSWQKIGHRKYDLILEELLERVARNESREDLLHYFCHELFQLSEADFLLVVETMAPDIEDISDLDLFLLMARNDQMQRNLRQGFQNGRSIKEVVEKLGKKPSFLPLNNSNDSTDDIVYHITALPFDFLAYFITPSMIEKEKGWTVLIHLPRATKRHPVRYLILYFDGFSATDYPNSINQDGRSLFFFRKLYKLASFKIRRDSHDIEEQRRELLRSLAPSLITHEIYHRIGLVNESFREVLDGLRLIKEATSLEDAVDFAGDYLALAENTMLASLNSLSEIGASIMKLTRGTVSDTVEVSKLFQNVKNLMSHTCGKEGIMLTAEEDSISIIADEALLLHALINLITNSIEAYRNSNCHAYEREIVLAAVQKENKVEICVSDNAKEIDDVVKQRMFEQGYTQKKDGNGLGLTICQLIVGLMGGEIGLYKHHDYVTTFQIVLPLESKKASDHYQEIMK